MGTYELRKVGAVGAIQQIKDRQYPSASENYGGELLLVGVNYDRESKAYECRIESVH